VGRGCGCVKSPVMPVCVNGGRRAVSNRRETRIVAGFAGGEGGWRRWSAVGEA